MITWITAAVFVVKNINAKHVISANKPTR